MELKNFYEYKKEDTILLSLNENHSQTFSTSIHFNYSPITNVAAFKIVNKNMATLRCVSLY